MLLDKIRNTIEENNLLQSGDNVICAISGGADSVCLLHSLITLKKEYNINIYAAHVNHMIRGKEAECDSLYVKKICKAAEIELFYREIDIPKLSEKLKIGEEECGRIMRYDFFDEISRSLNGAKIAVAHNLNDNAETILFHLIRGSSAEGLSGIKYKRDNIIRPLLDVTRAEIERYLIQNSVSWRVDSTNLTTEYTRNKIRLDVFPKLNEICKDAEKHIVRSASFVKEDNEFLCNCKDELKKRAFINDELLLYEFRDAPVPIKRRLIKDVLEVWGAIEITGKKIDSFISFTDGESGKFFDINKNTSVQKEYSKIVLKKEKVTEEISLTLDLDSPVEINGKTIRLTYSSVPVKKDKNNVAIFDGDKIKPPFNVRYRKDGDRIFLKGLDGSKKISDILTDEKVPQMQRCEIPIVEKDGEILFLCGLRQSALYNIGSDTELFLVIQYEQYEIKE